MLPLKCGTCMLKASQLQLKKCQDPALLADLEQVGFSNAEAKQMIRQKWRLVGKKHRAVSGFWLGNLPQDHWFNQSDWDIHSQKNIRTWSRPDFQLTFGLKWGMLGCKWDVLADCHSVIHLSGFPRVLAFFSTSPSVAQTNSVSSCLLWCFLGGHVANISCLVFWDLIYRKAAKTCGHLEKGTPDFSCTLVWTLVFVHCGTPVEHGKSENESIPYPYHPCMVYLATFGCLVDIGKYTIAPWIRHQVFSSRITKLRMSFEPKITNPKNATPQPK